MMSFGAQLRAFAAKAGDRSDLVARKVAIQIGEGVIMGTPVDTGHARANWQTEVGGIPSGEVADNDPSGGVTFGNLQGVALSWDPAAGSLFLANNLPYIERLEEGWSQQAPAGFVRATLMRFRDLVETTASEAKRERP